MMYWEDDLNNMKRKAEDIRDRAEEQTEAWRRIYGSATTFIGGLDVVEKLLQQEDQLSEIPPVYVGQALQRRDLIDNLHRTVLSQSIITGIEATSASMATNIFIDLTSLSDREEILSPKQVDIVDKYTDDLQVDEETERIRFQLQSIDPEVSEDFEEFLRSYQQPGGPLRTKYQALIGLRSAIFLKLIGKTAKKHGVREKEGRWVEKARRFMLGAANTSDPSVEETTQKAKKVWEDLSSDTKSGEKGSRHIRKMYKEVILLLKSLLALRSQYYTQ